MATNNKTEIKLLKKQIDKLDREDFDLDAWKTGAMILLERIFGPDNEKGHHLEKVKYDQSSWALREAKGSKNMMHTCKMQGREILEIAIDELEQLGLPGEVEAAKAAPFKRVIVNALEQELKIAEYRELVHIVGASKKLDEKQKELTEFLHNCGHDTADNILRNILLAEETNQNL